MQSHQEFADKTGGLCFVESGVEFLWLPEKGSHIVFTWPFVHFLTLPAAVAAKLLFQFKSDLEFKCVSHLDLHLGRPNFPRQPPTF